MTNKSTSFKRIALALVAALGFGVMSNGASQAYFSAATSTLTLSGNTLTANLGETVSVTATVNFTSTHPGETLNVIMTDVSDVTEQFRGLSADSVNVLTGNGDGGTAESTYFQVGPTNTYPDSSIAASTASSGVGMYIPTSATSTTPTAVQAKFTVALLVTGSATPGTYTYTMTLRSVYNGVTTNLDVKTLTLTINALDTAVSAGKAKLYVNDVNNATRPVIEADSTLVVSAGSVTSGAQGFNARGVVHGVWMNASDTNIVGPVGSTSNVVGDIILNASGPGMLSNGTTAYSTRAKSITLARGDTAVIWSDGTPGTMTITGYVGSVALAQAAKTVTFYGKVSSVTLSETTVVTRHGGAALSSDPADSLTIGTNLVTFTMKDSAGNSVRDTAQNKNGLFCIISDTSIVQTGTGSAAAALRNYEAPTISATGVGSCDLVVRKAGSVTITVADDSVVANSTFSSAKTLSFAKEVNSTTKGIGTIAFDKSSYQIGEKATITVTVLNADKAVPGLLLNGGDAYATADVFPTLVQNREFSAVGTTSTGANLGFGASRTDKTFSLTGSTFVAGVETYVVYMPTVPGALTLTGFTTDGTYDTATAVNVSVNVVDPNAALIAAAQAAAVAAADAAADAAAEAIDAANAATDAANLAAEAADAATVAAEEARDAADAATAAVEELATQVATLMAALKAQLTTLANTVAKIAKKVKA